MITSTVDLYDNYCVLIGLTDVTSHHIAPSLAYHTPPYPPHTLRLPHVIYIVPPPPTPQFCFLPGGHDCVQHLVNASE